jgi:hypothetical protein
MIEIPNQLTGGVPNGSVVPHLYSDNVGNRQLRAKRRMGGGPVIWCIIIWVNEGMMAGMGRDFMK